MIVIMKNNSYPTAWDLKYFLAIAQTGNLSRAAELMGVGQPALSLSLKRLETVVGAPLFLRRTSGLIPTKAGSILLKEGHRLISQWEAIVRDTRKAQFELGGKFVLGCHSSLAHYAINGSVRALYRQFPNLELDLKHGLSSQMTEQVISGPMDFAIVVNPVRHPDLVIKELATDDMTFWKTKGAPMDVAIYNPGISESRVLLRKFQLKNPIKRVLTSENFEVIANLAKSGLGVAIVPTRVAQSAGPSLLSIPGAPRIQSGIALVYRVDLFKKSPSAEVIVEYLKKGMDQV